MERVAVVGCSGGGKSTLARALGARLGLPVVHLDTLFWKPGWTESDPAEFRAAVAAALAGPRWVCDGGFSSIADLRFPRCDTIVWIDQPIWLCLCRAVWRAVSALDRTRADLAPGCPEKIDFAFYRYILEWNRQARGRLEQSIADHGAGARLVRLASDRQIAGWLSNQS